MPRRHPDRQPRDRAAQGAGGGAGAGDGAAPAYRCAASFGERGRVDPGALVLGVQGLAALRNLTRIWRLLVRGKINPLRTLLRRRTAAASAARRLLDRPT